MKSLKLIFGSLIIAITIISCNDENEELCDAFIGKEMTFDISQLQVTGNRVLLNITNSGYQIL